MSLCSHLGSTTVTLVLYGLPGGLWALKYSCKPGQEGERYNTKYCAFHTLLAEDPRLLSALARSNSRLHTSRVGNMSLGQRSYDSCTQTDTFAKDHIRCYPHNTLAKDKIPGDPLDPGVEQAERSALSPPKASSGGEAQAVQWPQKLGILRRPASSLSLAS